MAEHKKRIGIVYSTDPDFQYQTNDQGSEVTLPNGQQKLRLQLDKKQRGGKMVSLITGFVGNEEDLEKLGKALKNHCGTGGSAKDGEIIIQGDQRPKIEAYLRKEGYGLKVI
jgi:translation initiation factor 1